ncbi:Ig-like domain-containing protein [Rheinheimera sp. WS51]|uniref:Ig-like domain-containing protein n=1 Tax=Rheinheimera sp. WS51 TaxID=3425886 RepID=UPI003D93DBA2
MQNIQRLLVALFVLVLAACGGGGTLDNGNGGGDGGGDTAVYTLALTLTDSSGNTSTALSQTTPLTVKATLSATNNGVVANRVINFAVSDSALAAFGNASGTALTDANGVATINLLVGTKSGAGQVDASYSEVTASTGFTSAGDGGDTVDISIGSVSLIADSLQLGSSSADKVELSALVRDTNNVVVVDVPVTFSSDSGELVQIDAVTGANGIARATLTTKTDKNNRNILVNARVQQEVAELTVKVLGTVIEVSAPGSVVLADTATIDVFVTDSSGVGIQGVAVAVSSELGNTLSETNPVTSGTAGKASFTYTAVNSGIDKLTVAALGATSTADINVSADAFAFQQVASEGDTALEIDLNAAQELSVEWLVNDAANAGQLVTFNTTRGAIASSAAGLANAVSSQDTTDAAGIASSFVRSQFAGLATISARGGEGENEVSAKKLVEFVATNPTKVEVQAFPVQVGPGETSAIRAIVRDDNNNPVKGQTVVFSLDNAAGGAISSGTAVTNSQGVASTVFTADSNTGAGTDQLNLQIQGALEINNAIRGVTDIAVGERTLFFRFGTGNAISKPNNSTYLKEFSIIVTDSSGNPVANQELNVAVVPMTFGKGIWVKSTPEDFKSWVSNRLITCPNEDVDLNGILEPTEDTNGDGLITPGNVASVPQTVTADADGIATFNVRYPQDYATWLDVRLQVSGTAVGTENVAHRLYTLPVAAEDVTVETSPPPANPLGQMADCTTVD